MISKSIVVFGAGKIGRSFIGQIFGSSGYQIVFVDMDQNLVEELNRRGNYPVIIKGPNNEQRLLIENVKAIHALQHQEIASVISRADIMAISVGKNALSAVANVVANGLLEREKNTPGRILDIILAENMRSADLFFHNKLIEILPETYAVDKLVGLVETSIGKMVPIMTESDLQEDPLQVFAEPYNTLILSKDGFKGIIPDISEIAAKGNMKAWVDRKAFIHNLGHATAAYMGYYKHPEMKYMYEVLSDQEIREFTRHTMLESAIILQYRYPDEFQLIDLESHIDDLLHRFSNKKLKDTVFRVGSDISRKLGQDDRFMGVIRMAQNQGKPFDTILKSMSLAFFFKATDEQGSVLPGDLEFHISMEKDLEACRIKTCGLNKKDDAELIEKLLEEYTFLNTLPL
jgi:mannitol-1-phosphate 5-dehydrogenase